MANTASSQQSAKDGILMLLSDAEIGKVSMSETKKSLKPGDQFVDLDNLGAGVQAADASGGVSHLSSIIPRSAVDAKTWEKVVAQMKR